MSGLIQLTIKTVIDSTATGFFWGIGVLLAIQFMRHVFHIYL